MDTINVIQNYIYKKSMSIGLAHVIMRRTKQNKYININLWANEIMIATAGFKKYFGVTKSL